MQRARQWVVAFDGAPKPSLDNVDTPADHPSGLARVLRARRRGPRQHVAQDPPCPRSSAAEDPLEALVTAGDPNIEILRNEDVTRPGGLRGTHLVLNLRSAPTASYATTNYLALTDNQTRRVVHAVHQLLGHLLRANRARSRHRRLLDGEGALT